MKQSQELHARRDSRYHNRSLFAARALRSLVLGLVLLTAGSLALADQAPEEHCPVSVSSPEQAHWLADALFEQGAYQRAGMCYEVAGDHALANKAFLKAVGPQSSATTQQLSAQRDQAKALFRQLHQAFNTGH
jgi:TolA-binding protein